MRVTIDLMKKSTQIIDLSNVINPRVGDDDLLLPLHIIYGDNQTDMRGKDVEFLSNDPNKKNIYIAGTCNTNTPGDNLYTGDLTFRFPAGTFKADGTYDPDKTMFRIVDKETKKVISSVNVKITVMKNNIEFDFDPDNSSYDSRLETMLHDFHDKGQTMLDEIKDLKNQANSNVSGDTATTANEAKQQADQNAGNISKLKGEVAGARGRFADMAGREDAQDTAINQKESIINANANYAELKRKDAQQDSVIATKETLTNAEASYANLSKRDAQIAAQIASINGSAGDNSQSAAELKDARVASATLGGKTYGSVGEAIRDQIRMLSGASFAVYMSTQTFSYDTSDHVLILPTGAIRAKGYHYGITSQTINLPSSNDCTLLLFNAEKSNIYFKEWSIEDQLGDPVVGYIYGDQCYINGLNKRLDTDLVLISNQSFSYDYSSKKIVIPSGLVVRRNGERFALNPQTIDLAKIETQNNCWLIYYSVKDGMLGASDWTSTLPYGQYVVGYVYDDVAFLNGLKEKISSSVTLVSTQNAIYNQLSNVLTLPTGFVLGDRGNENAFDGQTLDLKSIETSDDCWVILYDRTSNKVSGQKWSEQVPANLSVLGYVWGDKVVLNGLNVVVRSQPIAVFGDSISAGTGTSAPYHQLLSRKLGYSFDNWAVGSTGYVVTTDDSVNAGDGQAGTAPVIKQNGNNAVVDQMKAAGNFSACIIAAGTNDYGNSISQDDFRKAVRESLDYALTKASQILIITPIKRKGFDTANSQGLKLADYSAIIKEEATKSGIVYVDGYDAALDPEYDYQNHAFFVDGLHPNNLGHQRLAGYLEPFIKKTIASYY